MPVKRFFLFFIIIFCGLKTKAQTYAPVNPDASDGVKKTLKLLYDIKGKYIMSGQQNYNSDLNVFSDSAKNITGKYPAVWGSDFINWGDKDLGPQIVAEATKKWQEGYLVTLMWHEGKPTDNPPYEFSKNVIAKMSDADWNELVTPGTELNKKWLAQIDVIAGYLKQLRDAGVPVLWRPYHEMNGVWFWWGNKKGENGIVKLWKMMYDRYTNYHHLNNLIWVWGANGLRDIPFDEAYAYQDYYPGANYVDVLGADVYHFDYEQSDYEALLKVAHGKPIALTETGELPKPEILKVQPQWTWFMVWTSWLWTDNTHDRVKQVYYRPQTLNHDEVKTKLDSFKK
ncbi:mannan endo-1,4-beta-mannosidase [Mucilaginibacter frigoritolerans]|uniref:Mannan endo-1,4-beta-mannosidase n=1 Tax=Mucilaginibacter frigoritolerans TaxID=652788 RepID=A0A562TWI7_9SPHI|nr:glycosyl hydrolase [Mucilaginibacter frigoritolerans]TWI97688.1 mannan endo-1,4-beta-mannosidase [Mucilaginibacter frigoritolerans]